MGRFRLDLYWTGRRFRFTDALDVAWDTTAPIASGKLAGVQEVPLTLDLDVDVPALIAQGYDLSQAEGELFLDDVKVLRGRAVNPIYGDPLEPTGRVRLTLRQSVIDDTALWPPPGLMIDDETWPNHDPASGGQVYPMVWGAPGADVCAGSPAYLVYNAAQVDQKVLVAGHSVGAANVRLIKVASGGTATAETRAVSHQQDGRGVLVAIVVVPSTSTLYPIAEGDELWVKWDGGDARSGLGGDVVADLLSYTTVQTDLGRVAVAVPPLNVYSLSFFINARVVPLEWLGDNLVGLLPISMVRDEGGLYPVVWRAGVTSRDAVAHLTVGRPDVVALGPISYRGNPVNEYTLRYQLRADTGDYLAASTADDSTTYYAEVSRVRYHGDSHDGRWATEDETDIVYDTATADRIVMERVRRDAFRRRTFTLWIDRAVWGRIRAGDLVTVTDSARALTSHLAWVETRRDSDDGTEIDLVLEEDPLL